jgi:hypothetical protein
MLFNKLNKYDSWYCIFEKNLHPHFFQIAVITQINRTARKTIKKLKISQVDVLSRFRANTY